MNMTEKLLSIIAKILIVIAKEHASIQSVDKIAQLERMLDRDILIESGR